MEPELQKEMEVEENVINHNQALIIDLVEECTEPFPETV